MSLDYVINEQDGINEQGGQISKKNKRSVFTWTVMTGFSSWSLFEPSEQSEL